MKEESDCECDDVSKEACGRVGMCSVKGPASCIYGRAGGLKDDGEMRERDGSVVASLLNRGVGGIRTLVNHAI